MMIADDKAPENLLSPARDLLPKSLRQLRPRELLVNECYLSIQGESSFVGQPCFFIRLTGCHLRCPYCDTEYAFFDGERRTVDDCIGLAQESGSKLVEITGGEPLLQKSVLPLMAELCDLDFTVLLETSGTVTMARVDPRVHKIVDVKTPSSNMASHNLSNLADEISPADELKFVVGNRLDYDWSRAWLRSNDRVFQAKVPIHYSPVHGQLSPQELVGWILQDRLPVRLNLQIHKYIWPKESRGV